MKTLDASPEIVLPAVLLETAKRQSGLILVSGTLQSGLTQTLETLLRSIPERQRVRWQDPEQPLHPSAEVVSFEGSLTAEIFIKLLCAAEEGRLVLLAQRTSTSLATIRRILSLSYGEGRRHLMARFVDQLLLVACEMRLPSLIDSQMEEARELILMTPAMKIFLKNEDLQSAEELLNSGEEGSGSVSFNQSLLKLLLRRKIDIKTAFEASPDPAHLDRILKKVGI